jgi:iron complex outermembrane receptor protein
MRQEGKGPVEDQITRGHYIVSGALDAHITKKALLQFDSSHYSSKDGDQDSWSFGTGVLHNFVPDASKDWGQNYTWVKTDGHQYGLRLNWDITNWLTLRTHYRLRNYDRGPEIYFFNNVNSDNTYTPTFYAWGTDHYRNDGGYTYLDAKFKTGFLRHLLTFGGELDHYKYAETPDYTFTTTFAPVPVGTRVAVPEPAWQGTINMGPLTVPYHSGNYSFVVGDVITINRHWSVLAGAREAAIWGKYTPTVDNVVTMQSYQNDKKLVPDVSLVYKPIERLTTYFTYTEGYQSGGSAPDNAKNHGQQLPPDVSSEYEIGAKATLKNVFLTVAYFDIHQAEEYLDPNDLVYKQSGRDAYRGIEFSATGKLKDRLSYIGSISYDSPTISFNPTTPKLIGNMPNDAPNMTAKVYLSYKVPYLKGFAVNGGVNSIGMRYADDANTDKLPQYAVESLGVSYATRMWDTPVTFRANTENLTNKNYWIDTYTTGAPRSVSFSAQFILGHKEN